MTASHDRPELPRWLWLYLPPTMLLAAAGSYLWLPGFYRRVMVPELGLVELATPLVLAIGVGCGIVALRHAKRHALSLLWIWIACFTLGCVYFAGEELSWGQQLFGWRTPAAIAAVNDQAETNIHNMSSWFDQKPRLLLTLWVLLGGIIAPPLRERWIPHAHHWLAYAVPTRLCVPAAGLAIAVQIPKLARKTFDLEPLVIELRWSELQEFYFGVFLSLYLASIAVRLRAQPVTRPGSTPDRRASRADA